MFKGLIVSDQERSSANANAASARPLVHVLPTAAHPPTVMAALAAVLLSAGRFLACVSAVSVTDCRHGVTILRPLTARKIKNKSGQQVEAHRGG